MLYNIYTYFIEVQLIYNIVLVSGVQQSDSVIYVYIYIYIYILFVYIFKAKDPYCPMEISDMS